MKLSKIKSTVLVIFTLLVVIFMLVYACTGDLINAVACGAIAILSLMLLVIYLFDDVVVILDNKNFDSKNDSRG
jgi:lipoprotein